MKTQKSMLSKGVLLLAMSCATFSGAIANEEQYLNNDPININGYVQEEAVVTDAELENVKGELRKQKTAIVVNKEKKKKYNQLSKSTEKLADVTEEMIEERKESRESIDKFNKKIDCLMAEGFKEGCEEHVKAPKEDIVVVTQAAPVVVAPIETAPKSTFGSSVKVLPYTGLTTFMSENEDLEAGLVGGLRVESNINSRFSVGIGFNYTTFKTEDFGGSNYISNNYAPYYNSYYNGRDIEYKNMNFDMYAKYFLVENNMFRPYLGAGLGYNRTTMEYSNNDAASSSYNGQYYGYQFGTEEVKSSNVNIELMLGSEVKFTESFGANLELSYLRGIGSNISSENGMNSYQAPDQRRLEDLSGELGEANIVSLFVGLLVEF